MTVVTITVAIITTIFVISILHTCHSLPPPPSEIDSGLCLAVVAGSGGSVYFTELAESVEYGNYAAINQQHLNT